MKILLFTCAFFVCLSHSFAGEVIKTCRSNITFDQITIPTKVSIIKKGNSFYSKTVQIIERTPITLPSQEVRVLNQPVQAGLTGNLSYEEIEKLNDAENLVSHAMWFSQEFGDSTGVDLKKIRSAKVFKLIADRREIGSFSIIEAKDKNGKILGSFIGGFLVSPCK